MGIVYLNINCCKMGALCGKEDKKEQKKVEYVIAKDQDATLLKLKMCRDKLSSRVKTLEKEDQKFEEKIKDAIRAGNKSKAKFLLQRKKNVKEQLTNYQGKFNFIDKQTANVEQAQDDVAFTDLVRESNQTIQKLNEQIDLEAIETAKALEKERKIQQAEQNEALADDEYDAEIEDEFAKLEAEILGNNFQKFDEANAPIQQPDQVQQEQQKQETKKEMMLA